MVYIQLSVLAKKYSIFLYLQLYRMYPFLDNVAAMCLTHHSNIARWQNCCNVANTYVNDITAIRDVAAMLLRCMRNSAQRYCSNVAATLPDGKKKKIAAISLTYVLELSQQFCHLAMLL
jgi:hypothetical protein